MTFFRVCLTDCHPDEPGAIYLRGRDRDISGCVQVVGEPSRRLVSIDMDEAHQTEWMAVSLTAGTIWAHSFLIF